MAKSNIQQSELYKQGEVIFKQLCVACHQANGNGIPSVFPPLNGSEWVEEPHQVAQAILTHGLKGAIKVKGVTYTSQMTAWPQLDDKGKAAVLTYIRNAWDNDAGEVSVKMVKDANLLVGKNQGKVWTVEDLKFLKTKLPEAKVDVKLLETEIKVAEVIEFAPTVAEAKPPVTHENFFAGLPWLVGSMIVLASLIYGVKKMTH